MSLPSVPTCSNKLGRRLSLDKRNSNEHKRQRLEEDCVRHDEDKLCADFDDYFEGDSIFSAITPEQLNYFDGSNDKIKTNSMNFFENDFDGIGNNDDDDDDGIQCTQKFINDINENGIAAQFFQQQQNNTELFDFNKTCNFIHGSQYQTRNDIRNKTIMNKTEIGTSENSLNISQELGDSERNGTPDNELYKNLLLKDSSWCSESFNCNNSNICDDFDDNFPQKGSFYGLPQNVEKLLFEHKGIKDLYEWQKECLTLPAIKNRRNLIYALPTSGGKTLVAEILMLREIICREKNVIFILPYVSIVQEKVASMSPFAINFDFILEEYAAGRGKCPPTRFRKRRCLFIASIEKASVLLDSLIEEKRLNEIGLIVVDELHLIGEKGRGAILESLLTKVIYSQAGIQIVGMSATIGNIEELSEFLDADIYKRGFRPVELKEFIKCGKDILEVNSHGKSIEEIFLYHRTVDYKYNAHAIKTDPDHIAGLISEVIPKESCLIFCPTKRNCENLAILLTKVLPKKKYIEYRKEEKLQLKDAFEKLCGTLSPILDQTIPFGIGYHHSGLTTDERKLLENAYRIGTISVICCTSTLAAGVNLPAKRVIIRAPYVGQQFMTLCQYKQMVGRAGRAGQGSGSGESILICSSKDNYQVGEMLFSPMDKILSSMNYQNAIGLESLILCAIGLNLANCLRDVLEFVSKTLLSVQSEQLDVSLNNLVTSILRSMFHHNILKVSDSYLSKIKYEIISREEINENTKQLSQENSSQFNETTSVTIAAVNLKKEKRLVLSKSTKFELTCIGKAAFKAGIDYKRAQSFYNELQLAQKSLVLLKFSHILYLVVSFHSNPLTFSDTNTTDSTNNRNSINIIDFLSPDPIILYREYNQMDEDLRLVAKCVGITEAHAIKMAKQLTIKGPVELQFHRLFKVMILNDVIKLMPLHEIALKYNIDRGLIQTLITQSISAANGIQRLCEEIEEFWCFKALFEKITYKLDHCCIPELAPLLDLPAVKIYRAKQLYNAGFKTIEDIARADTKILVKTIEHLSHRVAREIISAAKIMLIKKLEILQEETDIIMNCLHQS